MVRLRGSVSITRSQRTTTSGRDRTSPTAHKEGINYRLPSMSHGTDDEESGKSELGWFDVIEVLDSGRSIPRLNRASLPISWLILSSV